MIRLISVMLALTLGAAAIGVWLHAGSSGAAEAAASIPDGAAAITAPGQLSPPGGLTPPDGLTPPEGATPTPTDSGEETPEATVVVATSLPETGNGFPNTGGGGDAGVWALIGALIAAGATGLAVFGWRYARVR